MGNTKAVFHRSAIGKPPIVAHPVLVDPEVPPRANPVDPVLSWFIINMDCTPPGTARAYARFCFQKPDPLLEAEIAGGERSYRADIHHIHAVRIVEGFPPCQGDDTPIPPPGDEKLVRFGDIPGEADTPTAEDTPLGVKHHMGTERYHLGFLVLPILEPATGEIVIVVVVLKFTLPRLVADRTVNGVVDEEELQHMAPAVVDLGATCVDHHPFRHRGFAGNRKLGLFLNLNKADPAVSIYDHSRVIAIVRDSDPSLVGGLDDRFSRLDLERSAIYGDPNHRKLLIV
jgi:hypothetical protein